MEYVNERIVNISKLESLIQEAKINFEVLMSEIQKDVPSNEIINGTSKIVKDSLDKADDFEFLTEKRKCTFKDSSENQIRLEKVDETINAVCNWIQQELDETKCMDACELVAMTKALAELVSARENF